MRCENSPILNTSDVNQNALTTFAAALSGVAERELQACGSDRGKEGRDGREVEQAMRAMFLCEVESWGRLKR
jgi:hypothetical protein